MKNFITIAGISAFVFAPVFVSAQTLGQAISSFGDIIGLLTPIIVALALMAFFWGLAMYVLNFSGEDKDKKKGRDMMVYGILVLFVMVSVWGLVNLLQQQFLGPTVDNELGTNEIPSVVRPPRP
ncbi:hypothetical protein K2X83_01300 [Patescibacteria group bacterium]|nr:hypothetical protein [Patescibacteria group bacterium]